MHDEKIANDIRKIAQIFLMPNKELIKEYGFLQNPPYSLKEENRQDVLISLVISQLNELADSVEEGKE